MLPDDLFRGVRVRRAAHELNYDRNDMIARRIFAEARVILVLAPGGLVHRLELGSRGLEVVILSSCHRRYGSTFGALWFLRANIAGTRGRLRKRRGSLSVPLRNSRSSTGARRR
jgi:hypothetical protein